MAETKLCTITEDDVHKFEWSRENLEEAASGNDPFLLVRNGGQRSKSLSLGFLRGDHQNGNSKYWISGGLNLTPAQNGHSEFSIFGEPYDVKGSSYDSSVTRKVNGSTLYALDPSFPFERLFKEARGLFS